MSTLAITLADLRTANVARDAEWCPGEKPDLSFRGNELAGETGEACNVIKKLERERQGWAGSRATAEHLAEEIADVVICADLTAMTAGIDLAAAVTQKFNGTSEKYGLATRLGAARAQGEGVAVPAGWKLVPVKVSDEMKARVRANGGVQALAFALAAWPDLLAAAPVAPPAESGEVERPEGLDDIACATTEGALLGLPCDDQYRLAKMLAANVGYVLTPETEIDPLPEPVPGVVEAVATGRDGSQRRVYVDRARGVVMEAAPPPEPATTEVVVKPLKWKKRCSAAGGDLTVETVVGCYDVGIVHSGFTAIRRSLDRGDVHDTVLIRNVGLEVAKAVAQDDYELRILSALATPPAAPAAKPSPKRKGAAYAALTVCHECGKVVDESEAKWTEDGSPFCPTHRLPAAPAAARIAAEDDVEELQKLAALLGVTFTPDPEKLERYARWTAGRATPLPGEEA